MYSSGVGMAIELTYVNLLSYEGRVYVHLVYEGSRVVQYLLGKATASDDKGQKYIQAYPVKQGSADDIPMMGPRSPTPKSSDNSVSILPINGRIEGYPLSKTVLLNGNIPQNKWLQPGILNQTPIFLFEDKKGARTLLPQLGEPQKIQKEEKKLVCTYEDQVLKYSIGEEKVGLYGQKFIYCTLLVTLR